MLLLDLLSLYQDPSLVDQLVLLFPGNAIGSLEHLNPILIFYSYRLAIKMDLALKRLRRQLLEFSGLPVFLFHC